MEITYLHEPNCIYVYRLFRQDYFLGFVTASVVTFDLGLSTGHISLHGFLIRNAWGMTLPTYTLLNKN